MGGEKLPGAGYAYNDRGSPPHGRGKAARPRPRLAKSRITPAWAGKRPVFLIWSAFARDHPRMGGEKLSLLPASRLIVGSPPHGRGKGCAGVKGRSPFRITPAWAGKRHPSRCPPLRPVGSPPHGRGKVIQKDKTNDWLRITPAWAGKSCDFRYAEQHQ